MRIFLIHEKNFADAKKIVILGCPGSGKTTLANSLSSARRIKTKSMDEFYWQPNWARPVNDEWLDELKRYLNQDEWIVDGNYAEYLDIRLKHADMVIYLDSNPVTALLNYIKRAIYRYYNNRNSKQISINFCFIYKILTFNKNIKPMVMSMIDNYNFKEFDCVSVK